MTTHDHPRCWPLFVGLLVFLTFSESRADEWLLKIDGVPGELRQGRHAGWTSVQVAGAFASLPVDTNNAMPGPALLSCEVRKAIDSTSPWLIQKCARGEVCPRVTLAYVRTQPRATQYRITLRNALVTSVAQAGSSGSVEAAENETVKLAFDNIEFATFDLDNNGGTTGGLTALFDQATGQGNIKSRPPFRTIINRQDGRPGLTVTWPTESGHRYQVLTSATPGRNWTRLALVTGADDGLSSQFIPFDAPMLFVRVEEID